MGRTKVICIANDVWKDSDEMWGFNTFLKNGFDVEIWKTGEIAAGTKIWEETHFKIPSAKIHTWKQFYLMLLKQNMKRTIFLFYSTSTVFDKAKVIIKIFRGKYCVASLAPVFGKGNLIKEKKIREITHHFMDIFPASYNFLGTKIHRGWLHSDYEANKDSSIILHTFNYDYYLLNERKRNIIKDDYILFLDQNLVSHKDQVNFGLKTWIPRPDIYTQEIKKFLNYVETYYQMKIIIAAHPTSESSIRSLYGDRKIVYGETCNYVKYAKFVIAFSSGSLDFAVLYKKPILFWNCNQLKKTNLYINWQMPKVKKLHGRILNISKINGTEILEDYMTDTDYFDEFMQYISVDRGNRLFFDIVVDYLKEL